MGHAYEAVTSDVIARWHRAYGRDVFYVTVSHPIIMFHGE